ncbi:uncharacterized protein C630.12-like isoform X1 [Papaver somniferum]|uniref:uncharacterized protein C630.12-like isoform X1 n=1 Tax=Papaver somniferum TaxID=3469 RepID=UPI000E6FB888|nr:uncharacterized protein C630.12-like isoform X1 [Papaver somniferum]
MQLGKLTVVLCCVWVVTIFYGEMFAFWVPSSSCSWPQLLPATTSKVTHDVGDHVKVAVITDPQLMDHTSLALAPKSLALEIAQFYTDLYMRRSFLTSILPSKPDIILFLGDYFDGGPHLSDEEWQNSLSRFRHIFGLNHRGRFSDIPKYYISGNHDTGYSATLSRNPKVLDRYEKEFGSRNYHFTVGEVEFIAVDSQTLDGRKEGNLTSTTWDFVKNVSSDVAAKTRVLLTHIPLYRPDWTPCGSRRSSPIINQVCNGVIMLLFKRTLLRLSQSFPSTALYLCNILCILHLQRVSHASDQEVTYQNYLTEETSRLLLDLINPVLVLSGHDHDQCTVTHQTRRGHIKEHTLGTISWQQGNLYPSFMLLSATKNLILSNTSENVVSTRLCFLPMQTHIYIWYASLFILTVLALLLWPTHGLSVGGRYIGWLGSMWKAFISSDLFRGAGKEKDEEDENCEYEMVWDAEGSMHLVKKVLIKSNAVSSTDSESMARGNAVLRPVAKKNISQEASVSLEMNNADTHMEEGGMSVSQGRLNQSKRKLVWGRFVRTLRFLLAIAVVNLPLYMMFLAKDWID